MTKPSSLAVLALLRERPHSGVTALEALQEAGCFRLAARIADLKAEGFTIDTDLVATESGKRIAVYRLREKRQVTRGTQISFDDRRQMLRDDVLAVNDPRDPRNWTEEEILMVAHQSDLL